MFSTKLLSFFDTLQIILRIFQQILKLLVGVNFKGSATASA